MIAASLASVAVWVARAVAQGDPLPEPSTGPEEAQRTAEDILSEFSWAEPNDTDQSWLADVAQAIGEAIEAVVGALFGSGVLTLVVWAVLIGLVLWVAIVVARRWRKRPKAPESEVRVRSLEASRAP